MIYVVLFSLLAKADPITSLPAGNYFGQGIYYKDSGEQGNYNIIVNITGTEIKSYKVNDDFAVYADIEFNFEPDGVYNAAITKINLTDGSVYNLNGTGYCVSDACHSYVKIADGSFAENTVFFDDYGNINKVGSFHKVVGQDDNGNNIFAVTRWEEQLIQVP